MNSSRSVGYLFGGALVLLCLIAFFAFGTGTIGLAIKRTFGVANANVETEIQRQSRANVEGAISQLRNNQRRYYDADEASGHRVRLRKQMIRTYDRLGPNGQEKVPQDLTDFVDELKEKDLNR